MRRFRCVTPFGAVVVEAVGMETAEVLAREELRLMQHTPVVAIPIPWDDPAPWHSGVRVPSVRPQAGGV